FPTLGLVFFFHTVLQPPSTTLVPYTTLFRSGLAGLPPALRRTGAQRFIDQRLVLALGVDELAEARLAARDVEQEHGRMRELLRRDRKSTRLNSSHVKISYAVFCLKKKKNIQM